MSSSETFVVKPDASGLNAERAGPNAPGQVPRGAWDVKTLEQFLATGLGSRGGPNKVTNKVRRTRSSYRFS